MIKKVSGDSDAGKPAMQHARIDGAHAAVRNIGETIYLLDLSIEKWIEQLDRAQPHRNGRLLFIFTASSYASIDGVKHYDIEPVAGKMILMKSGTWRFLKLTRKDVHAKLTDLRVGKTLRSDPLVIRLIEGIEDMLKQRQFLINTLVSLRSGMPGKVAAIAASSARRYEEGVLLSDRVKLDWSLGAELAEKTIVLQNKSRNAAQKLVKKTRIGLTE